MEKFLFVFGPPAVGKATVGAEIAKITDLRLFHNHMTTENVRCIEAKIPSVILKDGKTLVFGS